jgi:hypothetical protein
MLDGFRNDFAKDAIGVGVHSISRISHHHFSNES